MQCTQCLTGKEIYYMADLGNPKYTIEIIQKYQFVFQKRFGQNFLIDIRVLDKIISAVGITEQGCVLGIGSGTGIMTQCLAEHAGCVVAVEIDSNLLPILDGTLKGYTNITVINDDILEVDVGGLVNEHNEGRSVKAVVNLSYYITTPIIMGLLESDVPIDNITVMVQKEVAGRAQVGPGPKDYGALSPAIQYYTEPHIATNVPPNYFIPRPNVGSAVIRLIRHKGPSVQVDDPKLVLKLVRASFNQCRKVLQNGLDNLPGIPYNKEMIAKAAKSLGVQPTIREETLNLDQFVQLSNYFTRNA